MTTKVLTDQTRLTVLKHLASGKSLDVVSAIVSLPRETVLDIGSQHGYPDVDKLAWAADVVEKKIQDSATALPERAAERTPRPAPTPAPGAVARPTPDTAAAPGLTRPDEIRVLINTAKAHPSKRIQAAGEKVIDSIDRLKTLIQEDQEKHAARRQAEAEKAQARAEIERLKRQLAEAQAKLRGAPKPDAATATNDGGPSAADVRAWAADNGVACPAVGRVPAAVREAYDDAHPLAEAS